MAEALSALAHLGESPISAEAPCGASARYEPEYENLEAEIAKLGSLTPQGESARVDWGQVVNFSVIILTKKSKDLLVASYLCRGLFEQQGYAGLEAAFMIYRDLIGTYWDSLFPEKKRMRGRVAAIAWLAERLESALERRTPAVSEHAAVKRCHELVDAIAALLDEKCSDMPAVERQQLLSPLPGRFLKLWTGLTPQEKPQQAPPATPSVQTPLAPPAAPAAVSPPTATAETRQQAAPEPSPVVTGVPDTTGGVEKPPETTPTTSSAVSAAAVLPTEFATESDVQKALRSCQTLLRNAATFLLGKNLADPLPYRLNRRGTWMMVQQPPTSQDGVTQLSGVQPEVIQRYHDALQQSRYPELIPEVESSFTRAPFWLGAHRFTAMALEALGSSYARARRAVVEELAHFLAQIPEVLDLKFADGTPFTDDQTRLWIEQEVKRPVQGSRAMVQVVSGDGEAEQPPWAQVVQEARQLAAKGKVIEAAALFQVGQRQGTSQRQRFFWYLQQARFCCEMGLLEVAVPQLEFLQEQVDRFVLEEWEPALGLEVEQLLLGCYYTLVKKTKEPPVKLVEKAERLRARLCRLDVTAVLALDGNA